MGSLGVFFELHTCYGGELGSSRAWGGVHWGGVVIYVYAGRGGVFGGTGVVVLATSWAPIVRFENGGLPYVYDSS